MIEDRPSQEEILSDHEFCRNVGFHPLSNRPSSSVYECAQDEFHCLSGECIDRRKVCNRQSDCQDDSDETAGNCPVNTNNRGNPSSNSGNKNQKDQDVRPDVQSHPSPTSPVIPVPQPVAPFECQPGEFSCTTGECIAKELTCDKYNDCKDGSDEAKSLCSKVHSINPNPSNGQSQYHETGTEFNPNESSRPLQRPTQGSQTGAGTTSSGSNYQYNGVGGVNDGNSNAANSWHTRLTPCRVPQQPANGRWRLHRSLCDPGSNRECEAPPQLRQMEPGSYLVYTCNDGFVLNGSRDVLCGPGGRWIHEPKCDEIKCPDLSSSTREAVCQLNRQHVSCEIPASVGTDAKLKCRNGFVKEPSYEATFANVTCNVDGTWKPAPIQCHKKPKHVKLVVQGDIVIEDE
ncbi:hypothetical protein QAD02_024239 [Eretmocerus hayati]|uniref:Uncharacterized protein n=1 Tax=Eretmocerus hayati TaxID=131215 RepID=A0ACC2Q0P4_9HYME|nr:hypothetical protein QAD02_024239 [Eretmocerus hayati]